ncbi:MAG: FAD-dependent oxidoreductase [Candidatus Omnitrophota bacterium]|nr:FAD-dependent oxidoreductase [Candidatus Omnitrophota bacterium]
MKIGILGGGLSGVSLSYLLDRPTEILEKEEECGGLCRSFEKQGITYDLGGHIIFSKDKEAMDLMLRILKGNVKKHYRNNKIWYKNRFIKYPFENGLNALDKEEIFECLYYYLENDYPKPRNLAEWSYYTFGKGIAQKYLEPYNKKIWKYRLEKIGLDWVERIPKPPTEDIIKSAIGINTEGYLHQLYFYYPKRGGIQSLIKAFEDKACNITKNFSVRTLKKIADKWIVSDGRREKVFDRIISTMPIFDLINSLSAVPLKVRSAVSNLRYNSLAIVMLGIKGEVLLDKFATYFPQKEVIFHRVCFNKYLGSNYTPKGKTSIVAEITFRSQDRIAKTSDASLIKQVIMQLDKEGFIDKNLIFTNDIKRIKYAYVIHDIDYAKKINIIHSYAKSLGIELCGRFSEFSYLNMDQCIRHAINLSHKFRKI